MRRDDAGRLRELFVSLQAALKEVLSRSGGGGTGAGGSATGEGHGDGEGLAACEGRARVLAELLLAIEHNHARRLAALELVPAAALDPALLRDALRATQALSPSARTIRIRRYA